MSFIGRALQFVFQKGDGTSFAGGGNTLTVPFGNQAQVWLEHAWLPGLGHLQAHVWGVGLDVMNELSTLGIRVTLQPRNFVTVNAMDEDGSNPSQVFQGAIWMCSPDMNAQPETVLMVDAYAGIDLATLPPIAQSYPGEADLIQMLTAICNASGWMLETNGVMGVQCANSYNWGDALSAIRALRQSVLHLGVDIVPDVTNKTVAVYYIQKGRSSATGVPLVSAGTPPGALGATVPSGSPGMLLGYPTYTQFGIDFRCIYTPTLKRGGQVQVQSSLQSATGLWTIYGLGHNLDAQIPDGKWESVVQATRVGYPTPIVTQ